MVKLLTLSYAKITHMQLLVLINTYKDSAFTLKGYNFLQLPSIS